MSHDEYVKRRDEQINLMFAGEIDWIHDQLDGTGSLEDALEEVEEAKKLARIAIDELVLRTAGKTIENWKDVGSLVGFKNIPMTYHNASKFRTGYNSCVKAIHSIVKGDN